MSHLLSKDRITGLLKELDEELASMEITGEICIYGGAVMCLVYQSRPATDHRKRILFSWKNLKVFIPESDYLLAMKCLASRIDSSDKDDIIFLIKLLKIRSPEEVFKILEKYYPKERIRPAMQYFIEEIFENADY